MDNSEVIEIKEADNKNCLKLKLNNGQDVHLKLNLYLLYCLKRDPKNSLYYNEYNEVHIKGIKDTLDILTIIYTGYLCANMNTNYEFISKEEFLKLLPEDITELDTLANKLHNPNAKD